MHFEQSNGVSNGFDRSSARVALIALALASAACSAEGGLASGSADESVASAEQALTQERDGTVVFNWEHRTADFNRTFRAYAASVRINHNSGTVCSGSLIGPNMLMSASHCGPMGQDVTLEILSNRGASKYTNFVRENFTCTPIMRTFQDTDLMLYFCPSINGVAPGDKYGYLDFEIARFSSGRLDVPNSLNRATVGTPVRTFWWNNLVQPTSLSRVVFVSNGAITSRAESSDWPSIQGGCGSAPAPIMQTDQWTKGGVSGSATLSVRNRIVGGPTSTSPSAEDGGRPLTTNTILDYITRTQITNPDGNTPCPGLSPRSQLARAFIDGLGLHTDDYVGGIDKNNNGMFDLHEDIERGRLLPAADFYWLGFESFRRNRAWATVDPAAPVYSRISATDENDAFYDLGSPAAIQHSKLNLKTGQRYHLTATAEAVGGAATLTVHSGTTSFMFNPQNRPLPAGFKGRVRFDILGNGSTHALRLQATAGEILLTNVALARDGANYDFLTFEQRMHWRTGSDLKRNALFISAGESDTSSFIDFAMGVLPGVPSGTAAIRFGSSTNRICFSASLDARVDDRLSAPNPILRMRVKDNTGAITRDAPLIQAFQHYCFDVPGTSADPELWFEAPVVGYVVDNISITGTNI
jgi:hypothetical protein